MLRESFNMNSRANNSMKNAATGISNQMVALILSFVYRTVFLQILAKEYLGINGLFTSILSMLSIAELGIGSVIVYQMYKPVAANDPVQVSAFLDYYKKIYRVIALIVACIGLAMMPVLPYLIKDASEIPSDINIYVIYSLFLMQSLSSYFFVYRTAVCQVDQRAYVMNIGGIITTLLKTGVNLLFLVLTKNFTLVLISGIVTVLLCNIVMSFYVTRQYKFVFKNKVKLDKELRKKIIKDTFASSCHRIGYTATTSTDNIIMTAFIGLGISGIYSNYSMIVVSVMTLMNQILFSFSASIGNFNAKEDGRKLYMLWKKLLYINYFLVSTCTIALFALFEPFITVWIGAEMTLDTATVAVIVVNFYLGTIKTMNASVIDSTGLFVKDKPRPLIEAAINLIISLVLVRYLGVKGIFIGTIVARLCTVFWREPYLLFKFRFKTKGQAKYYFDLALVSIYTVGMSAGLYYLCRLMPNNLGYLILKFLIVGVVSGIAFIVLTCRTQAFQFYLGKIKQLFNTIKARKHSNQNTEATKVVEIACDDSQVNEDSTQIVIDDKTKQGSVKDKENEEQLLAPTDNKKEQN